MITSAISAKGAVRAGKFSRVEEHVFIVTMGAAKLNHWFRNMLDPVQGDGNDSGSLIVHVLSKLKFNRKHVGMLLAEGAANIPPEVRWFKDADG